jgi:ribonuclease Z
MLSVLPSLTTALTHAIRGVGGARARVSSSARAPPRPKMRSLFLPRPARAAAPRRRIASGTTGGHLWVNGHHDMPLRASREAGVTLTFLGTGSGALAGAVGRGLAAALLTAHERHPAAFLFDCGDGTPRALASSAAFRPAHLLAGGIYISHLHGDHVYGLPGLVDLMLRYRETLDAPAKEKRNAIRAAHGAGRDASLPRNVQPAPPLRVVGPPGLARFLNGALGGTSSDEALARRALEVCELVGGAPGPPRRASRERGGLPTWAIPPDADGCWTARAAPGATVRAAPLEHGVACFGYVWREDDATHVDAAALAARGVPHGPAVGPIVAELRAGRAVTLPDGSVLQPADALRPGARGRKVAMFSDMRAASGAALALAAEADLLVHEATAEPGDDATARAHNHSSPDMAGRVAAAARARALALTHFGRAAMDRERASGLWALGLDEAAAELARRGGAAAPRVPDHYTAWARAAPRAGAVFEDARLLAAPHGAPGGAAYDFAFPHVRETSLDGAGVPGPDARAAAAVAAHRADAPPGTPPLPVICARDFMTLIVQPPGGVVWGAAGPLKTVRAALPAAPPRAAAPRDARK